MAWNVKTRLPDVTVRHKTAANQCYFGPDWSTENKSLSRLSRIWTLDAVECSMINPLSLNSSLKCLSSNRLYRNIMQAIFRTTCHLKIASWKSLACNFSIEKHIQTYAVVVWYGAILAIARSWFQIPPTATVYQFSIPLLRLMSTSLDEILEIVHVRVKVG